MKVEQFLEDSLNNKAFVLKKKHGMLRTICTFLLLMWLCIACFGFYIEQHWTLLVCSSILALAYSFSFYIGADHFLLAMPQHTKSLTIYKIDDDYFAGNDEHEAKLFAVLTNRQQCNIESIECYSFYKQTPQDQ